MKRDCGMCKKECANSEKNIQFGELLYTKKNSDSSLAALWILMQKVETVN